MGGLRTKPENKPKTEYLITAESRKVTVWLTLATYFVGFLCVLAAGPGIISYSIGSTFSAGALLTLASLFCMLSVIPLMFAAIAFHVAYKKMLVTDLSISAGSYAWNGMIFLLLGIILYLV